MKSIFFLASFFIYTASSAQVFSQYFKIYDTKSKSECSIDSIISHASENDVIFFGEEHNDSIAHFVQDTLYKALVSKYKEVTLSMEMFERDCQLVVDEYLGGYITEQQLVKEGRAWKNYKDYRKTVNTARQNHQKIVASNAPRRYVNSVSRSGIASLSKFPQQSSRYFAPLPIDTTNAAYAKKFKTIMNGHGNSNSYYAQTLWDATMAHSIYNSWKEDKDTKILHLNGRFHSDERLGTVTQLQRLSKKMKILTISCFAATDFNAPDWSKYEHLADVIIVTDSTIPKSF